MLPVFMQIIVFSVLALCLMMVLYRIIVGPHVLDRVMVLDFFTLIIIGMIVSWEATLGTSDFFDAVLLLTIIGFISTLALAKYLERGRVAE